MRMIKSSLLVAAVGICTLPVMAHHSNNMFDPQKEIVLKGTVKDFQWTNPHIWIQVNVPDAGGKVVEWSVEGGSPNLVGRQGWKRNSFKPGDKVTLKVRPMRNGDPGGSFISAEFEDGRRLGGVPAAPVPAATP
jgi:hypothetical protein